LGTRGGDEGMATGYQQVDCKATKFENGDFDFVVQAPGFELLLWDISNKR
jgi:hypothetical protein